MPKKPSNSPTDRKLRSCGVVYNTRKNVSEIRTENRAIKAKLKRLLKKDTSTVTDDESALLVKHRNVVKAIEREQRREDAKITRELEIQDPSDVLADKCEKLVGMIKTSKHVIVYTGAGISTAAKIPDYRGPNGVWTLLKRGGEMPKVEVSEARPTLTHMGLVKLHQEGLIHHIVSQNCDGLHVRSGFPRSALSEIHGNMYIEVCLECKPMKEYVRLFDVTERTKRHHHNTGRHCHACGGELKDTIVHFTELGYIDTPLNWAGAVAAVEETDLIICLGSSLKILRDYKCLWCMNRPASKRPALVIVNLQWTPKDSQATLKIHGLCDEVMKMVMTRLNLHIPQYDLEVDPLFHLNAPLKASELASHTKLSLERINEQVAGIRDHSKPSPSTPQHVLSQSGWFGRGIKPNTKKKTNTGKRKNKK